MTLRDVNRALAAVGACCALLAVVLAGFGLLRQPTRLSQPLRELEHPGPGTTAADGNVTFQVVAWRCGLLHVVGDHMPWMADGQYCRVRVRTHTTDRPALEVRTTAQEVVDAAGRAYPAETDAQQISDQPIVLKLGLGAINEFDVWFDVPADAEIVAVRLRAREDAPGVDVPLRSSRAAPLLPVAALAAAAAVLALIAARRRPASRTRIG